MRASRWLFSRILQLVPILWLISVAVFLLAHIAPGDPVTAMAGPGASPQLISAIKAQYHLDQPLPVQYGLWLAGLLRGDFGRSIVTAQPVMTMIQQRIGATITLAVATTVLYCLVAVPLGVVAARKRDSWLDRSVMFLTSVGISLPNFYTAMILIVVLGVSWRLLPITGWASFSEDPLGLLRHLLMPTIALSLTYIALLSRMVRSEMLDTLSEDYVRTARAKGLAERTVLSRHALRNSLLPAVTLVGINFATLLGGTVVIEEIFAIPGLGRLIIKAVLQRDFPVIQGVTLVIGTIYVLSSLAVDFLSSLIDPRIDLDR